jgi:SAM-dependent methyltransferase
MDMLFDPSLIAANRRRAVNAGDPRSAFLLDLVAEEMADRLSVVERTFEKGVELFGVTGATTRACLSTGKVKSMTRIEMEGTAPDEEGVTLASLEHLPLEPKSLNLVVSPLNLHLTNDTPGVLVQIARALVADGLFLAAIPGSGTLQELRDVLLSAEAELTGGASPRVIPFADVRDLGGLLQRAGFALPVVDMENFTVRYDTIFDLMKDLRAMGMANPLAGRSRRPASRALFLRAAELYAERYSDPDGRIRATFSILFASAWSPHESQQKPLKPGSAKVRLADALKAAQS